MLEIQWSMSISDILSLGGTTSLEHETCDCTYQLPRQLFVPEPDVDVRPTFKS
jgi:hypothetical protein